MNAISHRKTFSGVGRPRRKNVERHACGKIVRADQGESPEKAMATALEARIRVLGATKDNAHQEHWGSAMGRLFLAQAVAGAHLQTATRFARLKHIVAVLHDLRPSYGKPILAQLSAGGGRDPYDRFDPDQAWDLTDLHNRQSIIARVKQDDQDVTSAMWEMQGHYSTAGAGVMLSRVVLWDDIEPASDARGQALLRDALNRLDRLWSNQKGA